MNTGCEQGHLPPEGALGVRAPCVRCGQLTDLPVSQLDLSKAEFGKHAERYRAGTTVEVDGVDPRSRELATMLMQAMYFSDHMTFDENVTWLAEELEAYVKLRKDG